MENWAGDDKTMQMVVSDHGKEKYAIELIKFMYTGKVPYSEGEIGRDNSNCICISAFVIEEARKICRFGHHPAAALGTRVSCPIVRGPVHSISSGGALLYTCSLAQAFPVLLLSSSLPCLPWNKCTPVLFACSPSYYSSQTSPTCVTSMLES